MPSCLPARRASRRTTAHGAVLSSLLLSGFVACAAPVMRAVSDAELARVVEQRAQSVDDVAAALALVDLGPLAVPRPPAPDEFAGDHGEFWAACAFAWNPELRRARRELRAARAATSSAGAPGSIEGEVESMELAKPDANVVIQATFDLLGVFGLGPAAAARELARVEARAAFGEFESAVWRVRFEVERARIALAAARSRESALGALYSEASEDLPRIEILARRGWLGATMEQGALAALHMVEHRQSMAREDVARATTELATLCGLDAQHPAFARAQSGAIDRFRSADVDWREPSAEALLAALPELRAKQLGLATAEAAVRALARERWPTIRIGPRIDIVPGDTTLGGMLGFDIPFPGALDGSLAAAVERREGAREALEDALVAARARTLETRSALEQAILQLDEHAPEVDTAVARMFISAQAAFAVEPEMLERWSLALRERISSLEALIAARANAARAAVDYEEARGARAEVQK